MGHGAEYTLCRAMGFRFNCREIEMRSWLQKVARRKLPAVTGVSKWKMEVFVIMKKDAMGKRLIGRSLKCSSFCLGQ